MDAVTEAFPTVTKLVTAGWEMMTSNPYLVVFLAAGLLGVGIGILKMIKRAARR